MLPAVRSAVDGFDRIYDLQERQQSFESPAELLDALGVFNLTQTSAYDYFAGRGGLASLEGSAQCFLVVE